MKRAFIAIAICFAAYAALSYGQSTKSAHLTAGRFVLAIAGDGGTAWRLDTATGGIAYCVTAQSYTSPGSAPVKTREASCTEVLK